MKKWAVIALLTAGSISLVDRCSRQHTMNEFEQKIMVASEQIMMLTQPQTITSQLTIEGEGSKIVDNYVFSAPATVLDVNSGDVYDMLLNIYDFDNSKTLTTNDLINVYTNFQVTQPGTQQQTERYSYLVQDNIIVPVTATMELAEKEEQYIPL